MFCKKCGKYIQPGQNFCPTCGPPVENNNTESMGDTKVIPGLNNMEDMGDTKVIPNLNELENVLMSIINDWFDKEFYPYHDVLQSLVICGIDYERLIEISLMQTYGNLHSFTAVKNVVYQQIQEMARMTNKNIWLQETGIFNNYGFETTWVLGSKDSGKAFVFSDEQRARIQYELLLNNI